VTATRTRSQIGRSSRNKGTAFERAVANAIRPWYPNVKRSRDNGSAQTVDTGDLAGTPIFWSLKDVKAAQTEPPALIDGWLHEAVVKAGGAIPLLVIKRAGHSDPLMAHCWLRISDVALLLDADGRTAFLAGHAPVRMQLRHALDLLAVAGYAVAPA